MKILIQLFCVADHLTLLRTLIDLCLDFFMITL